MMNDRSQRELNPCKSEQNFLSQNTLKNAFVKIWMVRALSPCIHFLWNFRIISGLLVLRLLFSHRSMSLTYGGECIQYKFLHIQKHKGYVLRTSVISIHASKLNAVSYNILAISNLKHGRLHERRDWFNLPLCSAKPEGAERPVPGLYFPMFYVSSQLHSQQHPLNCPPRCVQIVGVRGTDLAGHPGISLFSSGKLHGYISVGQEYEEIQNQSGRTNYCNRFNGLNGLLLSLLPDA